MKFEQLSQNKECVDEAGELELADKFEREKMLRIGEEIMESIDKIKSTNIFCEKFIDGEDLVFFDIKDRHKATYKVKDGDIAKADDDEYALNDFLRGRRVDFVGIHTRNEFEEFMDTGLELKTIFDTYFFDSSLTYDEFVTHELAHGLFDRKYREIYGKYENENEISDVSDEYRREIKEIIIPLVEDEYPNLIVENFAFNRQQIAEIFALLYEREFCRKSESNVKMHTELDRRIEKFGENPKGMIDEINMQDNKIFNLTNDVYVVSHTLSFVVAKLLEEEYPDFEERMNIF